MPKPVKLSADPEVKCGCLPSAQICCRARGSRSNCEVQRSQSVLATKNTCSHAHTHTHSHTHRTRPAGAQQVPSSCPAGAQQVPSRCPTGAQQVPSRCPAGAQQVPSKCPAGAQQVPSRCPASAQQVPSRRPAGAQQVPSKCTAGAQPGVPKSCQEQRMAEDGQRGPGRLGLGLRQEM